MSLHMQLYDMIHPLRIFYYNPANVVALKAFPDTSLSSIDNIQYTHFRPIVFARKIA